MGDLRSGARRGQETCAERVLETSAECVKMGGMARVCVWRKGYRLKRFCWA